MSAMHFESIVFGPIRSRRLGCSLGINISPMDRKFCNFNCIYCECGWNPPVGTSIKFPSVAEFSAALEAKLQTLQAQGPIPDVITFSGNGEPTLHPQFPAIIEATRSLRDLYFPKAQITVLSNATNLDKPDVFQALMRVDKPILKIDSAFPETVAAINLPHASYNLEKVTAHLEKFQGRFILQTLFLRGSHNGTKIDNTTPQELEAWYRLVARLKPREITVYTIDRDTPEENLQKVSVTELEAIAAPLRAAGISVIVAG